MMYWNCRAQWEEGADEYDYGEAQSFPWWELGSLLMFWWRFRDVTTIITFDHYPIA